MFVIAEHAEDGSCVCLEAAVDCGALDGDWIWRVANSPFEGFGVEGLCLPKHIEVMLVRHLLEDVDTEDFLIP